MRHRVEFFLFQCLKWFVLALPLRMAQRMGAGFGAAAYHVLSSRRRVALENLQQAFPEKTSGERVAIAKGSFRNYGITLMELLWFPRLTDSTLRSLVKPKNLQLLHDGYARGKGMVMLSGHFGNWELIALSTAYFSGHSFSIIVQTQSNKLVDVVINAHRCRFGNIVIPMGISVREILRTLQRGEVVAIAPDQSGPIEGVFIEFFGRKVASHQGPAAFALRSGAPMQIGFIVRQSDGTYEVTFEAIAMDDLVDYNESNIIELTRRHTAMLESYIRRYPDHWLWMHRRWKHTWESVQREKKMHDGID